MNMPGTIHLPKPVVDLLRKYVKAGLYTAFAEYTQRNEELPAVITVEPQTFAVDAPLLAVKGDHHVEFPGHAVTIRRAEFSAVDMLYYHCGDPFVSVRLDAQIDKPGKRGFIPVSLRLRFRMQAQDYTNTYTRYL